MVSIVIACNKRGAFVQESEAKQSSSSLEGRLDCFVASLLAMKDDATYDQGATR
jgi:hypothetical protein